MLARYKLYRSYGHPVWVAATLAPGPALWYGGCIALFFLGMYVIAELAPK